MFTRTRRWLKRWLRVLARLSFRFGDACLRFGEWILPTVGG